LNLPLRVRRDGRRHRCSAIARQTRFQPRPAALLRQACQHLFAQLLVAARCQQSLEILALTARFHLPRHHPAA
jgi:hypothetical protein